MPPTDLANFLAGEPEPAGAPASGPPEPAAARTKAATKPGGAGWDKVVLGGRFEIDPGCPVPELNHAGADAFAARQLESGPRGVFALVCRSGLPPRYDIFAALRAIEHPGLLSLNVHGVARWPPDGVERQIVVYDRPARRLVDSLDTQRTPMREDDVVRLLIRPVTAALEELSRRRIAHGAVSPVNMFKTDPGEAQLLLGDCVTVPPGFIQPAAFEGVGRAMAMPAGRGAATAADDLYALGVSIVFLLLGRLPGAAGGGGGGDEALIRAKIEHGSFAALLHDAQLPQIIIEPVRGLLLDDPDDRWDLDDLRHWLDGRRQSPRRGEILGRTQRPVPFNGDEYANIRLLADAMAKDTAAANDAIQDGSLETSLRRAMDSEDLSTRIAEAKGRAATGRSGPLPERRVARVLMALDPRAPVRYRGVSVMPEGIGGALAQAIANGRGTQELAEIVSAQLPVAWIGVQGRSDEGILPLVRQFDMLGGLVADGGLGSGVERCLYEMEPSAPCGGLLADGRYILDADAVLAALDAVAARSDRPKEPIDRHVAAFLMARHAGLVRQPMLALSAENDPAGRCAALVDLYDILQRRTAAMALPRLCQWLASLAEPVIAGYHSRGLRDRVRANLDEVCKAGQIQALTALVNNARLAERDRIGFQAAVTFHSRAERTIAARRRQLAHKREIAGPRGRYAAAAAASLMSVAMVIGAVILSAM